MRVHHLVAAFLRLVRLKRSQQDDVGKNRVVLPFLVAVFMHTHDGTLLCKTKKRNKTQSPAHAVGFTTKRALIYHLGYPELATAPGATWLTAVVDVPSLKTALKLC